MNGPSTEQSLPALSDGWGEPDAHSLSRYDPETVRDICFEVAEGSTLKAALEARPDMSRRKFYDWLARAPEAKRRYQLAREYQAHGVFDEVVEIAREARVAPKDEVRGLEVAMRGLQWAAGRLAPQEYGDKPPQTQPMQIVITTGLSMDEPGKSDGGRTTYEVVAEPHKEQGDAEQAQDRQGAKRVQARHVAQREQARPEGD